MDFGTSKVKITGRKISNFENFSPKVIDYIFILIYNKGIK